LELIKSDESHSINIKNRILITGEKISANLLSLILLSNNAENQIIYPEDGYIITNENPINAKVNLEESKAAIQKIYWEKKIYIFPGFYGIDKNENITLLGRNGSDYSAAVVAYCINALSLDLWKDVCGIFSSDPKHFYNAKKINYLSYKEASEFSKNGAKVLHAEAVDPLFSEKIPLRIFSLDSFGLIPETIVSEYSENHLSIKGMTVRKDYKFTLDKLPLKELNPFDENYYKNEEKVVLISLIGEKIISNLDKIFEIINILKKNGIEIFYLSANHLQASLKLAVSHNITEDVLNKIHDKVILGKELEYV